jgi:acyl carrier protein
MSPSTEDRVKEFVSEMCGVVPGRLTPGTTLLGDLGVDGADGWELIEAFGEQFGVDLNGFDPSRHFGPEAGAFPPLFFLQLVRELVLREDPHKIAGVVPITVRDLVEAAESKLWRLP